MEVVQVQILVELAILEDKFLLTIIVDILNI